MIKDIKYAKYYMDNELNGKIIKIDKGFTEITGYTWEDVTENNMMIFDLIPEKQRQEYMAILYRAQLEGEAYLHHPIACKDGSVITVNCFGEIYMDDTTGHQCSKIFIIDVTEQDKAVTELNEKEEQLALQIEKIKFLTENAQEIFLDYDIQRNYLEISRFTDGQYDLFYSKENYIGSIDQTVHENDFERLCSTLRDEDKKQKAVFDFRSKLFTGSYRWYRLVHARYMNPKTGRCHIIGRLMDIDEEKKASLSVEREMETDTLTGVYNFGTVESKINEIAENNISKASHTMLLIDVDRLKSINDKYGRQTGDEILIKISEILCSMFRQNFDIIGRIYGDIFVVFIRNTTEIIYIEERCSEICRKIEKTISAGVFNDGNVVTASIGIALGDEKCSSFKNLYKKADKALQRQKENGRNGFSF